MITFDITIFGALGDGLTLNTRAIQDAADACRNAGGGILRVPAGTFVTGIFELFSDTTLLVEKEGRLLASPCMKDHSVGEATAGLLFARDAHNVILTGEGTLDGNASAFFDSGLQHNDNENYSLCDTWQRCHGLPYGTRELIHGPIGCHDRPGNMAIFARCSRVKIENLRVTGATYWTIHCADCEDVSIENLRIENDLRHPNNDGVHLSSCRRVKIANCWIACGDDAIAVTGYRDAAGDRHLAFALSGIAAVCENIEISDCFLRSRSSSVRIGYGHNPVRRVRLSHLTIQDSNRGIGIFARQADVEDIVVTDCRIQTSLFYGNWWGRGEPIHLSAVRFAGEVLFFRIRRVSFQDIEAIGENAIVLFSEEPGAIDDVKMLRVRSTLRQGALFENWGGNLDLRPTANLQRAIVAGGTAPLWAIGVSRLSSEDCQWNLDASAGPDFSSQPVIREA